MTPAPTDTMTSFNCHKCGEPNNLAIVAFVPDEQRLKISLASDSCSMITAALLGDLLTTASKTLKAVARNLDQAVAVFVEKVTVEHGSIEVGLVIALKERCSANTEDDA